MTERRNVRRRIAVSAGLTLVLLALSATSAGAEPGITQDTVGDGGTSIDVQWVAHTDRDRGIVYVIRATAPIDVSASSPDKVTIVLDWDGDWSVPSAQITVHQGQAIWNCIDNGNITDLRYVQPRPKVLDILLPNSEFDQCPHPSTYRYVVYTDDNLNSGDPPDDTVPDDGTSGDGIQHTITT
jgi:hypothetical protein